MNPITSTMVPLIQVTTDHVGQRIDNFLLSRLKGLPKSRLYRAVRSGEVRVNSKRVKASYRLHEGDQLRIPPLRFSQPKEPVVASKNFLELLEKSVIFEDKSIIIANKPTGVASHGGSGIRLGLIEGFRQLRPKLKFLELAHRLDRDTTGCIMLAKKPSVLKELHGLFLNGGIKKTYLALADKPWQGGKQSVNQPLIKNELVSGERRVKVHPEGKPAKTVLRPLQLFRQAALVEATPFTGRTHQIRVHMAYVGHAILGDDKYGYEAASALLGVKHLLLHAASLEFELGGCTLAISACMDDEFKRVLSMLQANSSRSLPADVVP